MVLCQSCQIMKPDVADAENCMAMVEVESDHRCGYFTKVWQSMKKMYNKTVLQELWDMELEGEEVERDCY